jgi:hypothetical protein
LKQSTTDGAEQVVLAEQAASEANVRCRDKNNDDKVGDNDDSNDGGAPDDNRRNHGAHNEDVDEGVTVGAVERADGVVPEQLQKFLSKGKEI